jgi:hypothetical protein
VQQNYGDNYQKGSKHKPSCIFHSL